MMLKRFKVQTIITLSLLEKVMNWSDVAVAKVEERLTHHADTWYNFYII